MRKRNYGVTTGLYALEGITLSQPIYAPWIQVPCILMPSMVISILFGM
jgi:hypothetical protein